MANVHVYTYCGFKLIMNATHKEITEELPSLLQREPWDHMMCTDILIKGVSSFHKGSFVQVSYVHSTHYMDKEQSVS